MPTTLRLPWSVLCGCQFREEGDSTGDEGGEECRAPGVLGELRDPMFQLSEGVSRGGRNRGGGGGGEGERERERRKEREYNGLKHSWVYIQLMSPYLHSTAVFI